MIKRVLLKISGAALASHINFGFEKDSIEHIVNEIISIKENGIQIAIMIGGGNIFRGNLAKSWDIERAEADNIGTMATVINCLILRGALNSKGVRNVRVMTANPMPAIAEPYIRLRAIHHLEKDNIVIFAGGTGQPYLTTDYPAIQRALEINAEIALMAKHGTNGVYTDDPKLYQDVRRFKYLTYEDAIKRGISVIDKSAFILAKEFSLPIHIFNFDEKNVLKKILMEENIGTYISDLKESEYYDE